MLFGLKGAPATFQQLMDQLLDGLQDHCLAYLDDIIVFSSTWEDHTEHLHCTLEVIQKAGLILHAPKCQFGMARCAYLGHKIEQGKVSMETSKIEAIKNFKRPFNKKDMCAFLGLTEYYCRFISSYSSISAPLSDATRLSEPTRVHWTPTLTHSFDSLCEALCKELVLCTSRFDRPFLLFTDAGDMVLVQYLASWMIIVMIMQLLFIQGSCFPENVSMQLLRKNVLLLYLQSTISKFTF